MNIDIKKISELNEAIYNDNLLFLVEDQDGKGKQLKLEELKSSLINKVYPIGSIYMSLKNISPASFLGGNWTQIKSKFLLGADVDFKTNTTPTFKTKTEGGNENITLTEGQMPNHYHDGIYPVGNNDWRLAQSGYGTAINMKYALEINHTQQSNVNLGSFVTAKAGNNEAHDNMPPYKVVFMWQRVED